MRQPKNKPAGELVPLSPENKPPAPAVASEAAALIAMLDRAAADPNTDVDKLERLYSMYERANARMAKAAYLEAMAAMQPELPTVARRGAITLDEKDGAGKKTGSKLKQSTYAKWEDVIEAIRPVLNRYGFNLFHRTEQPTPDRIVVTAVLGHKAGHSETTSMALPIEQTGSKNVVQGWGSATSYGRRYTTFSLLNIVSKDEDDDGVASGSPATLTDEQVIQITAKMSEVEANEGPFLAYISRNFKYSIASIAEIRADDFERTMKTLEAKKRASNG